MTHKPGVGKESETEVQSRRGLLFMDKSSAVHRQRTNQFLPLSAQFLAFFDRSVASRASQLPGSG